jgi:uncharacterized protein VirK/YbjX
MTKPLEIPSEILYAEVLEKISNSRERWKIKLGKLIFPKETLRWVRYVHAHICLMGAVSDFPKLLTKIYRPYACRSYDCKSRVDHLIQHYELARKLNLDNLIRKAIDQALIIFDSTKKNGQLFQILIKAITDGHREGEIELQLNWDGKIIYTLTCSFVQLDIGAALKIAKIQGSSLDSAKDLIKDLTKASYGARPQTLLLEAAKNFAFGIGCQAIVLVGNNNRVALNPLRRRRISADYDGMWVEHGAMPLSNGDFQMTKLEDDYLNSLSEVASHKRSMYRNRYKLFSEINDQIKVVILQSREQKHKIQMPQRQAQGLVIDNLPPRELNVHSYFN